MAETQCNITDNESATEAPSGTQDQELTSTFIFGTSNYFMLYIVISLQVFDSHLLKRYSS